MSNKVITSKKNVNLLALLFSIVYMVSYMTRINYGAIISEMSSETGIQRSLLAVSITGSFITYGIGQIVSGILGDKVSPKRLVTIGLTATALMNFLIPVVNNPYIMIVVWCVNGFAQSFMWPPLVKLMSAKLNSEDYKHVSTLVSMGSAVGTMLIYLIAPAIISLLNWKWVFVFSGLCAVIMDIVWNFSAKDIDVKAEIKEENASAKDTAKIFLSPIMICLFFAVALQGMLKDGVTTWMPSLISDTFNLGNAISILTGFVLPIFTIICFKLIKDLYTKKLHNPMTCATIFFGIGTLSAVLLYFFNQTNPIVSVIFSAVLTGCMHGVNLMLTCMIPPYFKSTGAVATVSGIVNAFTYVGSAVSIYGIAVVSENFGWPVTLIIWSLISLAGTVICLICKPMFAKKFDIK